MNKKYGRTARTDEARDKDPIRKLNKCRAQWDYHIKKAYGTHSEEVAWMYASQDGRCAACDCGLDFFGELTNIDHDHRTGKVRGILCGPCNRSLGGMKEDPDAIYGLMMYAKNRCRR